MNQRHPASKRAGSPLERRYRRLLLTYPREYRAERADEIVATYLDTVPPGRRWPSPYDATDILGAGLRERLREHGALGLIAALPLTATIALNTLVAVAAFLLIHIELEDRFVELDAIGPFQTLGFVAWLGWLLVGVTAPALPRSWTRYAATGVLLVTVALPPVAALTGQPRPPLSVLLPTITLGLATLALPTQPGRIARLSPLFVAGLGTAVSVAMTVGGNSGHFASYRSTPELLAMVGGLMAALALLVGLGRALINDNTALWATLLLTTPAALFSAAPLSRELLGGPSGAARPAAFAVTFGVIVFAGAALLAAALAGQATRHRTMRRRVANDACPTCGHRTTEATRT